MNSACLKLVYLSIVSSKREGGTFLQIVGLVRVVLCRLPGSEPML